MKEKCRIQGLRQRLTELLNYQMGELPVNLIQIMTIVGLGLDRVDPKLQVGKAREDGDIQEGLKTNFETQFNPNAVGRDPIIPFSLSYLE